MIVSVADGYSESPLGLIPENWEIVTLGEALDVRDGTHDSPKYLDHGIPFLTSKNLSSHGIDLTDVNYISEDDHANFSRRSHVENGDILFGMIGTIGNPVIIDLDFEISIKNVALIKFGDQPKLHNQLTLNLLKSDLVNNQFIKMSNGGVQSFISLGSIRKLLVPCPPLPEQKKIARILSSVDSKLALIDQQITTTQTLKKGLMQKLFTQGVGTQDADGGWQPHTEFQETGLGSVPKGWRVMPVGKVLAINNNLRRPISKDQRKEIQGPYPYYGPTKQQDSIATYEQDGTYALIGEDGDHFLKFASMPMTQLVHGKCTVNNHAHVLEGTEVCSAEWFYYFFMNRDIVNFLTRQGAGRYKLNKAALEKLLIAVPKKEEQEEIIKTIKSVSLKVSYLQTQKAQTQQLKKGLMQKLLTGQIRVQPDPQDN